MSSILGCSTEDLNDDGVLAITDFYVIGTNNNSPDETAEIDPYSLNNGEFDIFVKISKPDLGYTLNLYASGTENIEEAVTMYELECDDDDDFCYANDYYSFGCSFNTDITGECLNQTYNLSPVFDRLPFSGYIIAETCHRVQNRCVIASKRVIFR